MCKLGGVAPTPKHTHCTFEGCGEKHLAKGLCESHYRKRAREERRKTTPRKVRSEYSIEMATCAAQDCDNTFPQRTIGSTRLYCSKRCGDRVGQAARRATSEYKNRRDRPDWPRCSIEGCGKPRYVHGVCSMHHERIRKYGDPSFTKHLRQPGQWRTNRDGYVYRFVDGEKQLQHRLVMEEILGRALWPDESVHHLNGDRSDNSPDNLELWSSYQPAGQRVEDKVRWAREILARYT